MSPLRNSAVLVLLAALAGASSPPPVAVAQAQPYQSKASVMSAGGAPASTPGFRLAGTLGQSQAIGPMAGGSVRHVGGFWAALAWTNGASALLPPAPVDALYQNSPNPFNPATTISFSLAREGSAVLVIHDVRGRAVATLVHGWLPAGPQAVVWRGVDDQGRRVPSGLYFYKLDVGDFHSVRKLMVLK